MSEPAYLIGGRRVTMPSCEYDGKHTMPGITNQLFDRWKIELRCRGLSMHIVYHMGLGFHQRQPELADVLESMLSDVSIYESYGDNPDAWVAEGLFDPSTQSITSILDSIRQCAQQVTAFKRLIGVDLDWNEVHEDFYTQRY